MMWVVGFLLVLFSLTVSPALSEPRLPLFTQKADGDLQTYSSIQILHHEALEAAGAFTRLESLQVEVSEDPDSAHERRATMSHCVIDRNPHLDPWLPCDPAECDSMPGVQCGMMEPVQGQEGRTVPCSRSGFARWPAQCQACICRRRIIKYAKNKKEKKENKKNKKENEISNPPKKRKENDKSQPSDAKPSQDEVSSKFRRFHT